MLKEAVIVIVQQSGTNSRSDLVFRSQKIRWLPTGEFITFRCAGPKCRNPEETPPLKHKGVLTVHKHAFIYTDRERESIKEERTTERGSQQGKTGGPWQVENGQTGKLKNWTHLEIAVQRCVVAAQLSLSESEGVLNRSESAESILWPDHCHKPGCRLESRRRSLRTFQRSYKYRQRRELTIYTLQKSSFLVYCI